MTLLITTSLQFVIVLSSIFLILLITSAGISAASSARYLVLRALEMSLSTAINIDSTDLSNSSYASEACEIILKGGLQQETVTITANIYSLFFNFFS